MHLVLGLLPSQAHPLARAATGLDREARIAVPSLGPPALLHAISETMARPSPVRELAAAARSRAAGVAASRTCRADAEGPLRDFRLIRAAPAADLPSRDRASDMVAILGARPDPPAAAVARAAAMTVRVGIPLALNEVPAPVPGAGLRFGWVPEPAHQRKAQTVTGDRDHKVVRAGLVRAPSNPEAAVAVLLAAAPTPLPRQTTGEAAQLAPPAHPRALRGRMACRTMAPERTAAREQGLAGMIAREMSGAHPHRTSAERKAWDQCARTTDAAAYPS